VLSVREARHAVRVETGKLGKIAAPHAQSIGKAILAWLPEDEARRIVADTIRHGGHLSQATLAEKLRSEGYTVANSRLADLKGFAPNAGYVRLPHEGYSTGPARRRSSSVRPSGRMARSHREYDRA